jgi:MerR family transcriptional regulator, light-induced transcriptional regulator
MEQNVNYLNSEEAARILGVNVSSVKRWTDAGKLECIQTKGGHRKFLMSHLAKFLEEHLKLSSRVNIFTIENEYDREISYHVMKGNFIILTDAIYNNAINANRHEVQKILTGLYLGQFPLYEIYDHLLTPVLYRLGENWATGNLSIIEEHIGSQSIRDCIDRLQGIINIPKPTGQVALCMNTYSDLHDIALKMTQNILESRGFRTFFSGELTPTIELDVILDKLKPVRLYVSSTYVADPGQTQQEVDHIFKLCAARNIDVYVGGSGWDTLIYDHPAVKARLKMFEQVYNV